MKFKILSRSIPLSTTVPAGFGALALAVLLVTACGSSQAASMPLSIVNVGTNTEGLPIFRLDWDANSNAIYLVQSADSLAPVTAWNTLDAVQPAGQAGSYQFQAVATDSTGLSSPPAQFYRLVLPQPQIFSVEPAVVAPGVPVDIYVLGESFGTIVLQINGVTQAGAVVLSSSLAMIPGFTPDLAGNYQVTLVVNGVAVSSFNVLSADALANPELVLQGPPTEPPASPSKKDFKGHVTLLKAFDDDSDSGSARTTKTGHVTLMKAFDDGGEDRRQPVNNLGSSGQDGVALFSGEVHECDVDMLIPGRGLNFVWARTYHSRIGHTATLLGNCWSLSYDVHCAQNSSGGMDVYDGTGRKDTFILQASGAYTCPEFFREGTISNNAFTLTFADTGRWVFNPFDGSAVAGKLIQIITRNGDTMTLGYDTGGRLAQVVDDLDRTNTVAYTSDGYVASVTDFTGRSVTYQYYRGAKSDNGSAGDLQSVTSPPVTGTPNGNDFPSGKTTTYTYSKSFPLDRENHLLLTVADAKGQTAAVFTYEHSSTSVNYLHCIAAQEGTNPPSCFSYSAFTGTPHVPVLPASWCIVNDPVGNVTQYFYDARNRCVIQDDYTGRATPGLPVTDTLNRPTGQVRATDPAYYETTWSWNNDSLCTSALAPGGQQTQYVYQSDFDPSTPARKRADLRVAREFASSPVDLDGDGVADVTDRVWYFDYDPRFGSDPNSTDFLRESPTKQSLRESPTLQSLRESPTKQSLRESPTLQSLRESPTKQSTGAARLLPTVNKRVAITDGVSVGYTYAKRAAIMDNQRKDVASVKAFVEQAVASAHAGSKGWDGTIKGLVVPDGNGMAINRKGTGADPNRSAGGASVVAFEDLWPCDGDLDFNDQAFLYVVHATDARGNVATASFDAQGNPTSVSSGGGAGKVTFNPFSITRKIDCAYDTHGQRTAITNAPDANGRRSVDTFTWSQGQVVQCVEDAGGLAITSAFEYDARGNLTRYVDPRTNDWLFTYNALDQVVESSSASLTANGSLGTYRIASKSSYDANNNLVQITTDWLDAGGNSLGSRTDNYGYDGVDRLSEMALAIDATHARTNRYAYDGNDQCAQALGDDAVSGADPHQAAAYEYDERGLLFRAITAPGSALAATNELDYNPNGKIRRVNVELYVETMAFDGFDRLASVTDPMSNVVSWNYNLDDLVSHEIRYGKRSDAPPGASNIRLSESRWQYDALKRPVQFSEALFDPATQLPIGSGAAVSTCICAPNDECVSVTDSLGRTTSFGYDTACRLSSVTDARGNLTVAVIDALGNPTSVTRTELPDAGGSPQVFSCSFAYDSLNRCVSSSDNAGNIFACAYDSFDRVVRATNPNGNDTTYAYDLMDNSLACISYAGSSVASGGKPATVVRASYATYDSSSRCRSSIDANGNPTSYAYDSVGDCITITEADGTQQQLVWSPRGNLITETDASGTVISNVYDLCDRLVHRDIACRNVQATTTFETFAYDGGSRLALASNDVSSLSLSYDSLGDCIGGSQDGLAQSATYDSEGNVLSLTYPGGRVVTYDYDALNQMTNIATVGGGVAHPHLARQAYAGPGRLAGIGRDNGLNTQVDWDGLANPANATGDYGWQQVSRVRHGNPKNPSALADLTASYSRTQSKTAQSNAVSSRNTTLTYDAPEQLVESSVSIGGAPLLDTVYSLDADGNRQHVITNGVAMLPDYAMAGTLPPGDFQMNRYTTTPFGAQTYDADGNLIVRANAAGPTFYHYDYADRLVEVDGLDNHGLIAPVVTFTYDALGDRISKTTYPAAPLPPVTTEYVHDVVSYSDNDDRVTRTRPGRIESRQSGSLIDSMVNTPDDGEMTARFDAAGLPQYPLCDDLGNVLAITDAGGNVLERYTYDDYGRPQFLTADGAPLVDSTGQPVTASPVGNPYLFHSLEWDGETGLLGDGGGGYFDPQTGRAVRGKVKTVKDMGNNSRAFSDNNPWSEGGGGEGGGTEMKTGTVKFFNESKGFGFMARPRKYVMHIIIMK